MTEPKVHVFSIAEWVTVIAGEYKTADVHRSGSGSVASPLERVAATTSATGQLLELGIEVAREILNSDQLSVEERASRLLVMELLSRAVDQNRPVIAVGGVGPDTILALIVGIDRIVLFMQIIGPVVPIVVYDPESTEELLETVLETAEQTGEAAVTVYAQHTETAIFKREDQWFGMGIPGSRTAGEPVTALGTTTDLVAGLAEGVRS